MNFEELGHAAESYSDRMSTDLGAKISDSGWSEEYDCVPLRLRLKMLHSRVQKTNYINAIAAIPNEDCKLTPQDIFVDGNEGENLNAEMMQTANDSSTVTFVKASKLPNNRSSDSGPSFLSLDDKSSGNSIDRPGDSDQDTTSTNCCIYSSKIPASEAKDDIVEMEQLNNVVGSILHQSSSDVPGNVSQDSLSVSSTAPVQSSKVKHEILYEFDDALDNVVLRERKRMLVLRKLMQSSGSYMREQDNGGLSNLPKVTLQSAGSEKHESDSIEDTLVVESGNSVVNGYHQGLKSAGKGTFHVVNKCSRPLNDPVSMESRASPSFADCKSFGTQEITATDAGIMASSISLLLAKVKDEPGDISELCSEGKNAIQNFFTGEIQTVKSEAGFSQFLVDELDHLPLVDRVKLLSSGTPNVDMPGNPEFLKEDVASDLDVGTDVLESIKPVSISRFRKRKRTATNSVETALEEDAPGLLKVLLERGVSPEEIKLYGEEESDDALDDSLSEDSFAELEAVISQLFSQRQTFLKFPLLHTKGEKISYCLSCLLSLVEQTRYLQTRKWPVEWGWCRDLQSFIFVFQRHNRIVLERPEYGYATYFFELLNSVPVGWQIKRLVTAMKLTSCGRITLIENEPLVIGEDLSEGEARVLAEYGWTPNTGLGTMLNYCDRVVHDRKQEMDSSEWRLKIVRQLMNGYNGGNIVAKHLPKELFEYQGSLNVRVKLEK